MPVRGFALTEVRGRSHLGDQAALAALQQVIPDEAIDAVIAEAGAQERRKRRLPARLVVAFVLALGLWAREGLVDVIRELVDGLRERDPSPWQTWQPPVKSALSQARRRLGVRPLFLLFRRLAGPVAPAGLPGAFVCGRRVMAIDGTMFDLPDTPENARAFGRPSTTLPDGTRRWGPFPQLKLVWLVEVGTHVVCDLLIRPGATSEVPLARRLLRSVEAGMLVLWDRGLHSYDQLRATRERGADFLGRVSAAVRLDPEELLADGSFLTTLYPADAARRRSESGLVVRVIEYTIDDPTRPRPDERYRLVTSLLDPAEAPARLLALEYHQRWEIEGALDELKVHQVDRRPAPHVRSRHPREVVQELYGLVLAHRAIRCLMAEAAARADLDPDCLSFTSTLRLLRRTIPRCQRALAAQDTTPFFSTSS
jgi:Insertion element 4 transposase N-terminal/Transposase DDE domain